MNSEDQVRSEDGSEKENVRAAEAANCARSTVYEAIRALESGCPDLVNRLTKIRVPERDLFGRVAYLNNDEIGAMNI